MIEFFTDNCSCPNCGASTATAASTDYVEHLENVDVLIFTTECDKCGSTWDDFYKLVGHGKLKVKNYHLDEDNDI
jgi:C4-type Zn-finger protein